MASRPRPQDLKAAMDFMAPFETSVRQYPEQLDLFVDTRCLARARCLAVNAMCQAILDAEQK